MNSSLLKKALPHVIAIVVFLLVSIVFNKTSLEGKVLRQADVQNFNGMANQSEIYRGKFGHYPLWTESAFGGMPAYNIAYQGRGINETINISYISWFFNLSTTTHPWVPISFFWVSCVCFYILTQVLRTKTILGVLGSIAYAYATFNPILASVGHETELFAIGFMPAVVAGALLILRGKYLYGAAVLTLFFALEVSVQHLQIIYYTAIILGVIALTYLATHLKKEKPTHFVVGYLLIAFSCIVGLLNYAYTLFPTREYATESMRGGKSQLTPVDVKNKTKGGLNKDYAFSWSYGIGETLTLFVPGMQGGGSAGRLITENSKFAEKLTEVGVPEENALAMANQGAYWGDQPFTSGPVYLGAVICFLFILGIVYVNSWHKWWILSICVIGIVMAWGRHFAGFNYFLFDYLPLYNKFRAPSMALVMPQLGFALLGILGFQQFIDFKAGDELQLKKFKKVLYLSGGLVVVSLLIFLMSDFKSDNDARVKDQYASNIVRQIAQGKQPTPEMQQQADQTVTTWMNALHEDRKSIFQADLIRSVLYLGLALGLCWFYLKGKFKPAVLIWSILLLSSFDILSESRKYLNEESYSEPEHEDVSFIATDADRQILADTTKNFRVLDISSGDPFQSSRASYFFNSIGGYHPAKLGLYNDLIEHQLTKGNQMVYNMLNTKYVIQKGQDGKDEARINNGAFGPCWLVSAIHFVNNADQEMAALDSINVRDTAIVENIYKDRIPLMPVADSSASIRLIENLNDQISYQFKANTNQFAVFSEIFYDKGWNAFIDGKPAPYCRVDYVLRGMSVPAGTHNIEFRFEPESYIMGNRLSIWASILTYLLLIAAALQLLGIIKFQNRSVKSEA